eukprot:GFUD01038575.1.p1 GENE.GFUD01038575.1~~GFUD01038575.1.p1  ORF type:complete len:206 (-),score=27.47 GFUD01038575.1:470-1087(-)
MVRSRSRSATRSRSGGARYRTRSRSHSPSYRRRGNHSRSPMSNRRRHQGSREDPESNNCLGVFGLSLHTTERELEKEFGKFGPLVKINVVLDGKTARSRGFAFVTFQKVEDATEARNALSDAELDGKKIRVDFSITKRPHTPTPGVYMGRPTSTSSRGGGGRDGYRDRHRRSPSPYHRRRSPSPRPRYGRSYRSRSRSYSPRRYY